MNEKPDEVIVVCARLTTPLYLPDNLIGACSECGWKLQYRPHAPRGRKMCMECASDLVEPDTKIAIPPRMLEDLEDYFRKKRQ